MKKSSFVSVFFALEILALAACGSCGKSDPPPGELPDAPSGPGDGGTGGDGGQGGTLARSLVPTVATPMFQGQQTKFRRDQGSNCDGRLAASMGGTGFCYLAASDEVKCAGVIGADNHGPSFTSIGQTGAAQLMVMFDDSGMCITKTNHTVHCIGSNTTALGATSTAFTQWTSHNDVLAIGTGNWDQLCGITTAGQVFCGGTGSGPGVPSFGNPPGNVGDSGQPAFWVTATGELKLEDSSVLRPAEGQTDCQVRGNGLACNNGIFGPSAGSIVMGTKLAGGTVCWLNDSATVECNDSAPRFASTKVLYLAASSASDSMCAIYNDGSVWCLGANTNGKLGTGDTTALATATMVAPAGSAYARCN